MNLQAPRSPLPESLDISWSSEPIDEAVSTITFRKDLVRWVNTAFPGSVLETISQRPDRAHTISGSFIRLRLRCRGKVIAVLAAPENMTAEQIQSALTQSLLWLIFLEKKGRERTPTQVHILVPPNTTAVLCHRSLYLRQDQVEVNINQYAHKSDGELEVMPAEPPEAPVENRDFRWPVLGPFRWSAALGRVLDLAPGVIRRYPRFQDYDSLRLWGLEFARVEGLTRDRILFGIGNQKTELTDGNFDTLRDLVNEILFFRRADSPAPRHPFYRVQAERWLESLILENVPRLFPELVPETVYSQIPVYLGKDPGRVDILGLDLERRLVVMELKVMSDPDLPLQALDYWGRVIHHAQQGDFERRGYFSGFAVDRTPPRIYLVSPVFSFHDTTERLLSFMSPTIEVWKIAVNEDWRSGVKILRRVRLRCGGSI